MSKLSLSDKSVERQQIPLKKPYLSPKLVEYGSVVNLTQGQGSFAADGASGGMMGNP